MAPEGEKSIGRIVIVASVTCLALVVPRSLFAAPNLALPHSDYPRNSQVAVLPATNHTADRYFGPVHRSSFSALHRIDGAGWVQAAVWSFTTGTGGAKRVHQTVFAYAINVFPSKKHAQTAVRNLKVKTVSHRVSRIFSHLYQSSDGRETLVFLFFVYRNIEVETYYEYRGTAPSTIAKSLRTLFDRQAKHLAAVARKLHASINNPPPPPATSPTAEATATDTPTPTETSAATGTSPVATTPTATPVLPTATPLPSPTPTETPIPVLSLTASAGSATYASGAPATVTAHVLLGDTPLAGAPVSMTFEFPGVPGFCNAVTDAAGNATCTVGVPAGIPDNTTVTVYVAAHSGGGEVDATVSFVVKQ